MSRSNSIRGSSSRRTMPRKLCASLVISVERRNGCLINRSRLSTRMVPNRWKGGGIEARAIVRGGEEWVRCRLTVLKLEVRPDKSSEVIRRSGTGQAKLSDQKWHPGLACVGRAWLHRLACRIHSQATPFEMIVGFSRKKRSSIQRRKPQEGVFSALLS